VIFKNESLAGATDLLTLILIYFIAYCAFNQKQIFPVNANEKASLQIALVDFPQDIPRTARVSESDMIAFKSQLIHKMEKEKLYLNHELDLSKLSLALALSPHDLSYLLNEGFQMNFFDFVNKYRVEEAKRLLSSSGHKHLKIFGVAMEAGFNSKTTFNNAFKKFTGLAPSEFRKQNNPE
jgi:AraC-like DNA-binding protein